MADQFLGDLRHLPRRDALHVHLRKCRYQRLLGALVALQQLSREAPLAILRHPQFQLADTGDQRARIVAGAVAEPSALPPFSAPTASVISASSVSCTAAWISGFRNSLSEAKSCLTADTSVQIFVTVMGVQAPLRAVIFATTGLTLTASASQLLQNLPHTTAGAGAGC
jgi:hypothetical protein